MLLSWWARLDHALHQILQREIIFHQDTFTACMRSALIQKRLCFLIGAQALLGLSQYLLDMVELFMLALTFTASQARLLELWRHHCLQGERCLSNFDRSFLVATCEPGTYRVYSYKNVGTLRQTQVVIREQIITAYFYRGI